MFLTEAVLTVLTFLTELVLTVLTFLTELVLTVLIFLTELVLTVLIFLTEVVLTVLTFLTEFLLRRRGSASWTFSITKARLPRCSPVSAPPSTSPRPTKVQPRAGG
jgi:hypothetical protein